MPHVTLRRRQSGSTVAGAAGRPGRRPDGGGGTRARHGALVRQLAAFPVFAGCPTVALTALAQVGRVVSLPPRWTFVHQQTPADACYVLLDGHVRVLVGRAERAALGPGSLIGEMALLAGGLRQADVVTSTAIRALRIEHDVLMVLLRAHPHLAACAGAVFEQHRVDNERQARRAVPVGG